MYYVVDEATGKILFRIYNWGDQKQITQLRDFMQKLGLLYYPGENISISDATREADKIVLGKLLGGGVGNPEGPSETYYANARLLVETIFLGDVRQQELDFSYVLQLPGQSDGINTIEHLMDYLTIQKDSTYIFILKTKDDGSLQAIKILDDTEENRGFMQLPGN